MKYSIFIDPARDEEVLIYAHEKNELVGRLERLLSEHDIELLGYLGDEIVKLEAREVECFFSEDGRVFADFCGKKYLVKERLYQLEERLGSEFLKINQSCVVNVSRIERFETSIGGSLMIRLKGGYRDYVSRRQLKIVKERIGF